MSAHPVFSSSGGEVIAGPGLRVSSADAAALSELYQDEIVAAYRAGDCKALIRARGHLDDLHEAVSASARWRRASGGVRS